MQTAKSAIAKREISPGVWLQLLLLTISAALLASTLFKLDEQNNKIENSLNDYDEEFDEKIVDTIDLQKRSSLYGAKKMKVALQSLQDELQAIKTDYSTLDKKYVDLSQGKNASAATPHNNVNAYKDEILSLKTELQTVKSKLQFTGTAATVHNGLTVSLASLRNKNKVDQIAQQLYAEGLLPGIEQATVNGERVFRLSVSGFLNKGEAEAFIRTAGEKYGMTDSRLRKS